jgi:hypothetical protein
VAFRRSAVVVDWTLIIWDRFGTRCMVVLQCTFRRENESNQIESEARVGAKRDQSHTSKVEEG